MRKAHRDHVHQRVQLSEARRCGLGLLVLRVYREARAWPTPRVKEGAWLPSLRVCTLSLGVDTERQELGAAQL